MYFVQVFWNELQFCQVYQDFIKKWSTGVKRQITEISKPYKVLPED